MHSVRIKALQNKQKTSGCTHANTVYNMCKRNAEHQITAHTSSIVFSNCCISGIVAAAGTAAAAAGTAPCALIRATTDAKMRCGVSKNPCVFGGTVLILWITEEFHCRFHFAHKKKQKTPFEIRLCLLCVHSFAQCFKTANGGWAYQTWNPRFFISSSVFKANSHVSVRTV